MGNVILRPVTDVPFRSGALQVCTYLWSNPRVLIYEGRVFVNSKQFPLIYDEVFAIALDESVTLQIGDDLAYKLTNQ